MFDHYIRHLSAFDIARMGLNTSAKKIVKVTRKGVELINYLEFRGPLTWGELLGKHIVIKGPVTKGLTVGWWDQQDKTWKGGVTDCRGEIIEYSFPRQTLARLLKKYVEAGLIERIPAPREKGKRGRQAFIYRLNPSVSRIYYALRFKNAYFFGFVKRRNGKHFIQLYPRDKQLLEALCKERTDDGNLRYPDLAKAVKQDRVRRKHGLVKDERWAYFVKL